MINRVKSWKILLCFAVLTLGLNHFSPGDPPAGGQGADQAAQALDLLNSGKLPEAEQAYSALIQQFPTSGVVPEALFRLGYVQYLQGEYNQAVETLQRITSPPATPEIKTAADALIPQALAANATKMNPADPDRKVSFQEAIKHFDDFIQKYPNSPQVESVTYGRSMAAFQMQDYDTAAKGLQANLQHFPNSDSTLNDEDLLALVFTAQAGDILRSHGDTSAAMDKYNQALRYLANIIEQNKDVTLSNDAQFQIGEVLFARGNAEKDPARAADLEHAIEAYRAVKSPDMLMPLQQARAAAALTQVRQAARSPDAAVLEQAQKVQDRENAKLQALKQAPDQTLNAQLRIASCYFRLGKYDEARVLLHYLQGFAQDDDQKKQIAYYLTLSYASQGVMDKAEQAYSAFQAAYRADPLGENLPLVMGSAFMSGSNNNPQKAATYLAQERQLYPGSPLVNDALNQQAAALTAQHRYDEAISTYQQFLASNPPRDQAAEAETGIAVIYQQTGKQADAVRQYQKVGDDFPGTAAAEKASFYAAGLEISLDPKQALTMLQAFTAKFPNSQSMPQALMIIAQVEASQGDLASALQGYKDVVAKYPSTEFAPQAYFQQAAILSKEDKTDDMVALLKDFLKAYPDNKDIFYAYDTIGQTEASKGNVPDAIATYTEMADQHADNPMAPLALYRVVELWHRTADSMGRYQSLTGAQRATWQSALKSSIAAAEELLTKFPDADQVAVTLTTLLADHEMLLGAQLETVDDIGQYFHALAARFGSDDSAKSRIIFTLATFTYQKDPVMGLAQMGVAYNPAFVFAPGDLDIYGSALLAQGKADDAYKVYQKIAKDYPIPPNTQPAQAMPTVQEAQATALYGMASALDKEGKPDEAGKLFAQLKATYPWSPKIIEATYGIARSLVQQNKLDDATKLLVSIVSSRTASASLRAHAFLLIGKIQEQKGNIDAAIDSYLKTAAFYASVTDAAAEALWRGGQMLEKQAGTLTEQSTPKKSEQIAKAVSAYKDIGTKYPDSPFYQQAQDRLKALGS